MHINHAHSSKPSSSAEQKRTFQCCHVHNFAESGGRECEMSSQQQRTLCVLFIEIQCLFPFTQFIESVQCDFIDSMKEWRIIRGASKLSIVQRRMKISKKISSSTCWVFLCYQHVYFLWLSLCAS